MARRKSTKSKALTKAQRDLYFATTGATSPSNGIYYVDIARELSKVNRKLFRQSHCYGIENIEVTWQNRETTAETIIIEAQVAPDTWVVNNAHVKGQALHREMNALVLDDNPSIEGKWADFKVYLEQGHLEALNAVPSRQLAVLDGGPAAYANGTWFYSRYVMPQHDVNPATGEPLPAEVKQPFLLGDDATVGAVEGISLVKAYSLSRATVQDNDPNVPAGMSTSFFNLLTDSGSQEPELADLIEILNDDPPYDLDDYPGGPVNGSLPAVATSTAINQYSPVGYMNSFVAPCGLIRFRATAFDVTGIPVPAPEISIRIRMMAGNYKGIAAIPMGQ